MSPLCGITILICVRGGVGGESQQVVIGNSDFYHNELGGVERYRQPCPHLVSCEFIFLLKIILLRLDYRTSVLTPRSKLYLIIRK